MTFRLINVTVDGFKSQFFVFCLRKCLDDPDAADVFPDGPDHMVVAFLQMGKEGNGPFGKG